MTVKHRKLRSHCSSMASCCISQGRTKRLLRSYPMGTLTDEKCSARFIHFLFLIISQLYYFIASSRPSPCHTSRDPARKTDQIQGRLHPLSRRECQSEDLLGTIGGRERGIWYFAHASVPQHKSREPGVRKKSKARADDTHKAVKAKHICMLLREH